MFALEEAGGDLHREEARVCAFEHRPNELDFRFVSEHGLPFLHVPAARAVAEGSRYRTPIANRFADERTEASMVSLLDGIVRLVVGLLACRPPFDHQKRLGATLVERVVAPEQRLVADSPDQRAEIVPRALPRRPE